MFVGTSYKSGDTIGVDLEESSDRDTHILLCNEASEHVPDNV